MQIIDQLNLDGLLTWLSTENKQNLKELEEIRDHFLPLTANYEIKPLPKDKAGNNIWQTFMEVFSHHRKELKNISVRKQLYNHIQYLVWYVLVIM